MVKVEEKLRCVSPKQLEEIVESGLNFVRISFSDNTEPIFIAFKDKPTVDEISDYIRNTLNIIYIDGFTITWNENNHESKK